MPEAATDAQPENPGVFVRFAIAPPPQPTLSPRPLELGRKRVGHVVVVGNEKGGAGKSTVSVHLTVAALQSGLKVAAIDLDRRQRTFERYFDNRRRWCQGNGVTLVQPEFHTPATADASDRGAAEREEARRTQDLISDLVTSYDLVVIDSPGANTAASRAAHQLADTIITPMNDSFVDFDLLAEIDPVTGDVVRPSYYSQMVFEARQAKAKHQRRPIDWVVVRNRLAALDARNKRRVGDALATLSGRIGFRVAPGLSERVIFREMFPAGLTLIDLTDEGTGQTFSMSHVAARQELREMVLNLRLPVLAGRDIGF
jgi:chromosome partitioning protein